MPAKVRTAKRRRKPTTSVDQFAAYLDAGSRVPADPTRLNALSLALVAANAGRTLGPVGDAVEVLLLEADSDFGDYLSSHAVWWSATS